MGLASLAEKLVKRRRKFDEPLGQALFQISALRLWWYLEYKSFGDYCRNRLGISESSARQRTRLEGKLKQLPPLREALRSGRLTYTKALEVSRHATRKDVRERIAQAEHTTFQQTRREADAEEDRKNRAKGVRKIRGPAEVVSMVREVISLVREAAAGEGEEIDAGEAKARLGDGFEERWRDLVRKDAWRSKWEQDAMRRHGGLCAVPGCSRVAKQLHHIVFRENNGQKTPINLVAVCWAHHKLCIHKGLMTVYGHAGKRLTWIFWSRNPETGGLKPDEAYDTFGADNVVRKMRPRKGDDPG
jgi:5-methylcytosine-specific restriction endonuclease McrA